MNRIHPRRRAALARATLVAAALAWAGAVQAHGSTAGAVLIEHPYAVVANTGAEQIVAVHFRALANRGKTPERLLAATTSLAAATRLQVRDGATGAFRDVDGIDLPPGVALPFRHDGAMRIVLVAPKRAVQVGDRFDLRLQFRAAGSTDVEVWVQQPRAAAGGHEHTH